MKNENVKIKVEIEITNQQLAYLPTNIEEILQTEMIKKLGELLKEQKTDKFEKL